ncbi:putative Sodium/sulfate symporter [Leptomonas pyrrhocoris]|uniref:Putative Sodium/sulfate symporter n=1 Tax=Leptomonas pyrrhocoris TaxID=157538 RepID=A0A0N0DZA2_LEPPY|nr:putative Sodium/sulfate symporter [Leptomonas pyrrhocoris]XP_015663507.1 putative Sodium/sulfate symporter [Leptomonas pyrrhocoris]XP_015663508.1 putative Sodium/sulfate symporter [Leptomonas pyrrhocoris]KPA85067.1 putative Sodium/sulfate symporter [Leptomonas pyrrhocoris]KPA85068.1 putative Sodium/sulfate symporter [Leptomonas pyrrhocoris]KPA85069.1 putative Sodium/sulfate symporter [Leptomonas pyrrhocoris]|eukprot:XP_015663506.1 putative Sodium/sulfate symporter [Leptomonas pyrrhocoris]
MKFGKRLQDEIVPEWEQYYVNYKRLKQFIHNSELRGSEFGNELFKIITEELAKAEGLFQQLMGDLQGEHDRLMDLNPDLPVVPTQRERKFHRRSKKIFVASDDAPNEETGLVSTTTSSMCDPSVLEENAILPESNSGLINLLKRLFYLIIGDSQVKAVQSNTPRALFLEWHSNAHQLQHFAELNIEAIRKSAKKLKKYRRLDGDFTAAIEAEISRSRLTTLMPRLHNLMSNVSMDFERKFKVPLDQYANVTMSQEWHARWRYIFLGAALFMITMRLPVLSETSAAHNCLALFVLVITLWITEAIPFFCTAMLIPLFAVPLGIVMDPDTHQSATATVASQIILGKMFNHVQILVMGGLTIAKACSRTNLEMYAASSLHRWTAHRPPLYLLGVMMSSCLLCAFVSNVAAPLLVLGVVQRTLWEFPEGTNAPHGILLGLAFACNIGGMLSPIASPQNAVAITALGFYRVSFAQWVGVALPVVLGSVVAAWLIVLVVWKPFKDVPYIPLQVVNTAMESQFSPVTRAVVVLVSALTIILWVLPANLFFGDTGIVALIPIVVFFGVGILSKEDFSTLSWHLLFLLAGGNMLGLCAHDSRMLDIMAMGLKTTLTSSPPYVTLVVVLVVVGIITTFVSHTVAAMILLPIIAKIGFLLPQSSGILTVTPQSMVMLAALMCSGAMAFPISSFPNVNSLLAEDSKGKPYLRAKDFLFCGTMVTMVFTFCLVTWMVPLTNYVLPSEHGTR